MCPAYRASEQSRTTGPVQELFHPQHKGTGGETSSRAADLLPTCPPAHLCSDGYVVDDTWSMSSSPMFPCENQGGSVELCIVDGNLGLALAP